MVDVVLCEIKHIPGVPEELVHQAIAAGALEQNRVFGLIAFLPEKPSEKIYIEIVVDQREQLSLLKKYAVLPIEQSGVAYRLLPCWREYVGVKYTPPPESAIVN